ncbi:MAG: hypothetical protein GXO32_02170 [Crenarchaeota archaeon]|nr:hypothetical protein [Thermoproteota archaeon]
MPRVYSGRDCGRFIEPLIRNARRRLWIVSPYISREYAEILVEKARQGVDVRVVTCDVEESRDAIRVLRLGMGKLLALLGVATLAVFTLANIMHFAGMKGGRFRYACHLGAPSNCMQPASTHSEPAAMASHAMRCCSYCHSSI